MEHGKSAGKRRGGKEKKTEKPERKHDEAVRLNRFISNSGICSRREADELIRKGHISVNGKVVTDLSTRVTRDDLVKYKNKSLSAEKKRYVLLNKPKGYVTTLRDPHADHTVLELVRNACKERIYPVGRLDKDTTGVLLFTNDGELARKLTHPGCNRKKIYHVFLDKPVTRKDIESVAEGTDIEGEIIIPDAVAYPDEEDKSQIGIELHSGRNRVVRRIFEKYGYRIRKLDRVYFAGLTKLNLPRGRWRFLTEKEINMLKRNSF
ncbi:MAG: pseudouridine synthase [Bacteroidales bacterium]|jgi:23S rRNA pseudouridine2605 synthase